MSSKIIKYHETPFAKQKSTGAPFIFGHQPQHLAQGTGGIQTSVCAAITSAHHFISRLGYVEALTKLLFSKMPDNIFNTKINVKCSSINWDARIILVMDLILPNEINIQYEVKCTT